jgi:hypothetical protein
VFVSPLPTDEIAVKDRKLLAGGAAATAASGAAGGELGVRRESMLLHATSWVK